MRRLLFSVAAALALAACHNPNNDPSPPAQPGLAFASPTLVADAAAAHQAADRFLDLAKGSAQSGQLPTAQDPAAGPLIGHVFDMNDLPTAPVPIAQLSTVGDWMTSVSKVGRAYVLAGTGADGDDKPTGPAIEAQVDKNFAAYAPEIGRYLDAQNALMALETASLLRQRAADPGWPHDPIQAQAIATLQPSVIRGADSMLTLISHPGATDEWRRARMPYLLSLSTQIGKLATPADLAALRTHVAAVAEASDDATMRVDLDAMDRSLGAVDAGDHSDQPSQP